MNIFLRWYYRNKFKFWISILIILGIYFVLMLLNNFSEKELQKEETKTLVSNVTEYTNKDSIKSQETIIGGQTKTEDIKTANEIIDNFIKYCNKEEIEKAYELLSDNCKDGMFPTIDDFIKLYYNNVFGVSKTYQMQNWSGNTYKIEYKDSLLSTGGIETDKFIRDYIKEENSIISYKEKAEA